MTWTLGDGRLSLGYLESRSHASNFLSAPRRNTPPKVAHRHGKRERKEPRLAIASDWPRCPDCGQPRHTSCPVCGTAGHQFDSADPGWDFAEAENSEAENAGLLLCTTCDEPFRPQYLRHCEWCGHEFGDGTTSGPVIPEDGAELNSVATSLAAFVVALLAGFALYLLWLG